MPLTGLVDPQNKDSEFIRYYLIFPWVCMSWIVFLSVLSNISTGSLVISAEHEQKSLCGKFTKASSASDQWVASFFCRLTQQCSAQSQIQKQWQVQPVPLQRKCTLHSRQASVHFPVWLDDDRELWVTWLVLNSSCVNLNDYQTMQKLILFSLHLEVLSSLPSKDPQSCQRK